MKEENPIYSRDVVEFATIAVQYCVFLEATEEKGQGEFVDTLTKLLPLLYLKGTLLPDYGAFGDEMPVDYVTEDNYNIVRNNIAFLLKDKDDYLDVFVEDMKYSDTPILMTISENLADIYQDIKNFACAYKTGADEEMMAAITQCKETFKTEWGQKLTNVLRALHEVKYNNDNQDWTFDE